MAEGLQERREIRRGIAYDALGALGVAGITLLGYELGRVRDQAIPGLILGGLAASITVRYLLPGYKQSP